MIVVADSSPLHYLILREQTEVLRVLYGQVLIPNAVATELRAAGSPGNVSAWVSRHPSWLRIVEVTAEDIGLVADELDLGERAAIALAEKSRAELLLIDESAGRAEAQPQSFRQPPKPQLQSRGECHEERARDDNVTKPVNPATACRRAAKWRVRSRPDL